jgi:predicted MPP superfamily phosphohydrolase
MGRGRHYDVVRRGLDVAERALYGSGWAARLAYALGLQGRVHVDRRALGASDGPALRVAFVSDLHAGPLTDPRVLDAAAAIVTEDAPDLVLLGGDYVCTHEREMDGLARFLASLRPRLGVFGVLGNHDLWQDDVAIARALTEAGVRVLVNEEIRLPAPFAHVVVYGMDEPGTGDARAPAALQDGDVRIVLMHSPPGLELLGPGEYRVAFCGHTHGGQVATPSGRPILLPHGAGGRRLARGGLFEQNGGQLLVSRGVGMSDVPVRIFAPSEVHLCTIGVGRAE